MNEHIKFQGKSIDLIRTLDNFGKKSEVKKFWKDGFGDEIVSLSLGVVHSFNREENLRGIRLCLRYLIIKLKRVRKFFRIFESIDEIGDAIYRAELVDLIVESLIYTVIEFRDHLDDHQSGLSRITRTKLVYGFELVCIWAAEGVSLLPEENDWVVVRENSNFRKYISREQW